MRAVERIKASSERFQPHRKANTDFQPRLKFNTYFSHNERLTLKHHTEEKL